MHDVIDNAVPEQIPLTEKPTPPIEKKLIEESEKHYSLVSSKNNRVSVRLIELGQNDSGEEIEKLDSSESSFNSKTSKENAPETSNDSNLPSIIESESKPSQEPGKTSAQSIESPYKKCKRNRKLCERPRRSSNICKPLESPSLNIKQDNGKKSLPKKKTPSIALSSREEETLSFVMSKMIKGVKKKFQSFELPLEWMKNFKPTKPNYKKIQENLYRVARPKPLAPGEENLCDCAARNETCGENCINRVVLYSCIEGSCPVGDKCENQKIPRCDNAPFECFYAEMKGWGLKASAKIPSGRFVVEYAGEVINQRTCDKRYDKYLAEGVRDFYFLDLDDNRIIDAYVHASEARFINHSCEPNCMIQRWHVGNEPRVAIIASRDIAVNEEITIDYGCDVGSSSHACSFCKTPGCRGYIGSRSESQELKASNSRRSQREQTRGIDKSMCCGIGFTSSCNRQDSGNDSLVCSFEKRNFTCDAYYHTECLLMEEAPLGQWICPRHSCDVCSRGSSDLCPTCVSSWCRRHTPFKRRQTNCLVEETCSQCEENGGHAVREHWKPWEELLKAVAVQPGPQPFALPKSFGQDTDKSRPQQEA